MSVRDRHGVAWLVPARTVSGAYALSNRFRFFRGAHPDAYRSGFAGSSYPESSHAVYVFTHTGRPARRAAYGPVRVEVSRPARAVFSDGGFGGRAVARTETGACP